MSNAEKYKDYLLKKKQKRMDLALCEIICELRKEECNIGTCIMCAEKNYKWLLSEYTAPYKITQTEKNMLEEYLRVCNLINVSEKIFVCIDLGEVKVPVRTCDLFPSLTGKGTLKVKDILDNCEVID